MQYASEAFLLAYVALLTIVAWLGVAILYLMAVEKRSGPSVIVNNFIGDENEEEEDEENEEEDETSNNEEEEKEDGSESANED